MDGVLTDFDGQFLRWFGESAPVADYKSDPRVKEVIDRHLTGAPEEFWADMPWLPGGREFWDALADRSPIILSSPHFAPACVPGKLRWVHRQLGSGTPVILDRDKAAHGAPGDVLVDDTPANAVGWPGRFVLHTDWTTTWAALAKPGTGAGSCGSE
jgi:hypothetical protein